MIGQLLSRCTRPSFSSIRLIAAIGILSVGASLREPTSANASADHLSAKFTICGDQRRVNCVVDGDTFWFRRQKIRMADIDAPELSPPRCANELQRGEAAKQRLQALLNAGPFSLEYGSRDADRYGRKLRVVIRNGRSLGAALVEEELARRWDGSRRPWCW
jgi:micrococcal nuclease